jgi:hypothetical protein
MIEPLEAPFAPEVAESLDRLMGRAPGVEPLRLFRTIAHHPDLLERFRQIGSTMLSFGKLEDLERETVIQHMTARSGADYERLIHEVVFGPAGPPHNERQQTLMRMVDELHETSTLTDETRDALAAGWSDEQLVELLCLAGFYKLVSFICNAAELAPEEWASVSSVDGTGRPD